MAAPTHLAFLLHMHQPLYIDPQTGRAELPWVRLHAARGYLDVAWMLERHPGVALTVNFVPSLVEQLERFVGGDERDAWLELARRPTWTPEEREMLLRGFFSVHWGRNVETRPRYRELLEKRGRELRPESLRQKALEFSDGELRDLTVLFHLAWLGFAARADETHGPTLEALERKGRLYDEEDLAAVLAAGRSACARVLPLYRALEERGQIELSSSPTFHPILPLVCDSDAARRALPDAKLPARYAFPDDARMQISRGRELHRRVFGREARGMWPPEGSVSPEALLAYRDEGIGWLATDEGNLWRSLDGIRARGELYRPHRFHDVDLVFRDRELSDRIGFAYAFGDAASSVDDLIGRVRQAGAIATPAVPGEPPLVSVILDGENPWEAYSESGRPFLGRLFETLERERATDGIRSTTIGGFLGENRGRVELGRIHSGSWIDSDFHIWIGDAVKNRAWELLGRARRRLQRSLDGKVPADRIDEAHLHLCAAEGSDWFWWFGEPFHSAEDEIFDRLFRAHLAAAWMALGEPVPTELGEPVALRGPSRHVQAPRGLIAPRIDGRIASYYDWIDAGRYDVPHGAAMAEGPIVTALHFGFDEHALYLRLDPSPDARARLPTAAVEVVLRSPERELVMTAPLSSADFSIVERPLGLGSDGEPHDLGRGGHIAYCDVVEMSAPFQRLGLQPGTVVDLLVRLREGAIVLGRLPRDGHLTMTVPDENFAADHWSV